MMTLRPQKLMLFTLVLLIFMALAIPPVSSPPPSVTLSVDPPSGTITDPTYTIEINISYVENLWAIHFQLSFNDGIDFLQVDIPEGVEPGNLSGPQQTWDERSDIGYGSVGGISYLDVTILAPNWENNGTMTGEGSIAKITFELKENARPEMTSWLKLELADGVVFTGVGFESISITLVSGTVTVGLLTTTLTLIAPSNVTVYKPIIISAALTVGGGNPIANQTIDYYVNSTKWDSDDTDDSGVSSTQYTPTEVGTLNIQAVYNGSLIYAGSNDTAIITVTVFLIPTTLTLSEPLTATVDRSTTIAATLEDEQGNPLDSQPIRFYVDFEEIPGSPTTTNPSGLASISYTPPAVGKFLVLASYNGSANYVGSFHLGELEVNPLTTTLSLDVPTSTRVEDQIILTATLKDQDGNPIPASTIDYQINKTVWGWNPLGFAITNPSGLASFAYTPTEAGTFKIRAEYGGAEKHTGSTSEEATLTVNKVTTNLTISVPPTATVKTSITISATLKDEDGNLLPDSTIHYHILQNGKWTGIGSTQTNQNGAAPMNYPLNEEGIFKLRATYGGDQKKYAGSTSEEATLEVTTEEPETPKEPWDPWGFLLDDKMTTLDILFWILIIVTFITCVVVIVWRKIK